MSVTYIAGSSITATNAATLNANFPGCKDKTSAKQIFMPRNEPIKRKTQSSDPQQPTPDNCIKFAQGQKVNVDERDGQLWCIRPNGELECYWTLDKAVNVYDLGKNEKETADKKKQQ